MAQRIKADGEEIGMVAMFDSRVPALMQIDADNEAAILSELVGFLNQFYQAGIDLSYDALQSLDSEGRLRLTLDRVQQVAFLPVDFGEDYARRFLNVTRAHLRALAACQPIVSDVPLVLFRAADSQDTSHDPATTRDLGWRRLVGDLAAETVPGNHVTMLAGDQARRLAQLLSRHMSQRELSVSE
jgi:thioesterase domain-containing protein